MDTQHALLILEAELLDSGIDLGHLTDDDLRRFGDAVATAATMAKGYSGLSWLGGARLIQIGQQLGYNSVAMFDSFGWVALANGIRSGLQDKRLLEALSYATVSFLPPQWGNSIFLHPMISEAIHAGFAATPRPFIKPSDLGAASPFLQAQFGEFLEHLQNFSTDNELHLQWAAAALRVLPTHSNYHRIAGIKLLQALYSSGRLVAAYYAFRALAEEHDDLWQHPTATTILRHFISQYWMDETLANETIVHICIDDEILLRSTEHLDLLILIGSLAINLMRRDGYEIVEATAWHFVNELFEISAMVARVFENYLTLGSLPPLPVADSHILTTLEQEFIEQIIRVENELRPRSTFKPLALKIYQSNIKDVFIPLFEEIQQKDCSVELITRIREIDPEEIITESEWLQSSPFSIGTRVLRKMATDNTRILQVLESAALKRIELENARTKWANYSTHEFDLFREFDALSETFGVTGKWALETLLPDLWKTFQLGVAIMEREQEVRRSA